MSKEDIISSNLLKDTRCYLIGSMEYSNGEGWRNKVKSSLSPLGIKFFDPYIKPFVDDLPEDDFTRKELIDWRENGKYDLLSQRMKLIRSSDLRLCDISDWFIAVINPKIPSWGSAEEITTVIRQKKVLFLVIDDPKGKKACPLWLFGALPHDYIYNSLEEVIEVVKGIDRGIIPIIDERWKLLKPSIR